LDLVSGEWTKEYRIGIDVVVTFVIVDRRSVMLVLVAALCDVIDKAVLFRVLARTGVPTLLARVAKVS